MRVTLDSTVKSAILDYFSDSEQYRMPSRDLATYNVFSHYFLNIYHAEQILRQVFTKVLVGEGENHFEDGVYSQFTLTGHGTVRPVPGQGDMDKLIIAQLPIMMSTKGEETALSQQQNLGELVICSDLPRAIHHAVLKYHPERLQEMRDIADDVDQEAAKNKYVISKETHLRLINIALDCNIVPTYLLGSHFHGPRAGFYEKPDNMDETEWLASGIRHNLFPDVTDD